VEHTTSEAAGQGIEVAWVARFGFLAFGCAVLLLVRLRGDDWGRHGSWLHATFGILMVVAAAFSSRPWDAMAAFDPAEDMLHSVAATGMGFAFALGVGAVAWLGRRKVLVRDVVAMAASVVLPLGMAASQTQAGLLQRRCSPPPIGGTALRRCVSLPTAPSRGLASAEGRRLVRNMRRRAGSSEPRENARRVSHLVR
jgi:hypothetical protein